MKGRATVSAGFPEYHASQNAILLFRLSDSAHGLFPCLNDKMQTPGTSTAFLYLDTPKIILASEIGKYDNNNQ
jgi:hypothetical protein